MTLSDSRGPLRSTRSQIVDGVFGHHTSVVDFCEENYQITPYIAEFTNTLSNSAYVILGSLAIYYSRKEKLPGTVTVCHAALIVLGIGSAIFHATLMKVTMIMDTLPMMWLVSVLFYSSMQSGSKPKLDWPLAIGLFIVNAATLYGDVTEADARLQYASFALVAIAAASRFLYLMLAYPQALRKSVRTQTFRYFGIGTACILGGFLIWNLDNIYCDDIHPYKQKLGLPATLVLEGHAYWHILTAIGEYLVVTSGTAYVLAIQEGHSNFTFKHGFMGLPYVAREVPKKAE